MAQVTVKSQPGKSMRHDIQAGAHKLVADAGKEFGGTEGGPNPHELLLASLGACTAMTLKIGAGKREWDLRNVHVDLKDEMVDDPANPGKKITKITRVITVEGNLTSEQIDQLKVFADKCPIHKLLVGTKHVDTQLTAKQLSPS